MDGKVNKITFLMFTFLTFCSNNYDPLAEAQETGNAIFPVHGGVNIIADDPQNCPPGRINRLNNAYYFLRDYVGSVEFRNCLYDAFMVQTQRWSNPLNNADADVLWEYSNSFRITEIHCGTCADTACSGTLTNGTETLTYDYAHIDGADPRLMAGVMLHELMHDYGFFHSMGNGGNRNIEYLQAPTGVAGQCLYNVAAGIPYVMDGILIGRSELDGQIELGFTGGDNVSEPFDQRCPDGTAVVALGAFVDNTNNLVTGIRAACAAINLQSDSWSGSVETLIMDGNTSNSSYYIDF